MCSDDIQNQILQALQAIHQKLDSDEYEFSDPITIGGPSGNYQLSSNLFYNTECEWAIMSAQAIGTFGFVAAGVPTEFSVPATAGNVTIFTGSGVLNTAIVTATGTTDLEFQDGAGNIIAEVPSTATLDQVFTFNEAFNVSLVALKATTTPVVTLTYTPTNTTAASAANFTLGSRNPTQSILSASNSLSPFGGKEGNPLQSYVGSLTNQIPFVTYSPQYMPLVAPGTLYLQTSTPASTAIFITLQLRRKLEFFIPTIAPSKPHTHTPLSARGARTFYAGFAEGMYRHGVPVNPQPDQDTGRFAHTDNRTFQAALAPKRMAPPSVQTALNNLKGDRSPAPPPNPHERRPRRIS